MKPLSRIATTLVLLGASVASPVVLADGVAQASAPATAAVTVSQTSQGDDFWLAFEGNYDGTSNLGLSITTTDSTTGAISIPGLGFTQAFVATAGDVTQLPIPVGLQDLTSDQVRQLGIHVTSVDPVTVSGLNAKEFSSDGFLALPTDVLGRHYVVQAYSSYLTYGSQFEVVATADATTVTITPSQQLAGHPKGVPFSITLQQGQTYQVAAAAILSRDVTGTDITSDQPIAVFAGNRCASVPVDAVACNTLAEELEPVDAWGRSFVTEPFATRKADLVRILAGQDGTTVSIDGAAPVTLAAGAFIDRELAAGAVIEASQPVQALQYSQSHSVDNADGDPFDTTVIPTSQFLTSYTLSTPPATADPALTRNYLNIVAESDDIGSISLDGAAVDTTAFTVIGGSKYSGAQIPISPGAHRVDGQRGFGVTVYGYGPSDGYGYPAGLATTVAASSAPATAGIAAVAPTPDGIASKTGVAGPSSSSAPASPSAAPVSAAIVNLPPLSPSPAAP